MNFYVCWGMPSPLPIYSLFFFFTSSKTISGMTFSINECKGGKSKWGRSPWQNYQEINFFLKLWHCSWVNQSQSQISNFNCNYFCVWTCLNSHAQTIGVFLIWTSCNEGKFRSLNTFLKQLLICWIYLFNN